jgi:hypothetical protein
VETTSSAYQGYEHSDYAASLSDFGTPTYLEGADAWILKRPIPGSVYADGMGTYPLFFCRKWTGLNNDLINLSTEIISFAAVTDPFTACDEEFMRSIFDVVKPFKEHFITDLQLPIERIVSKSHRENARRALRNVKVDFCNRPEDFIEEWDILFSNLVRRHQIQGIKAFSRRAFEIQMRIPGLVMFRATERDSDEALGHDLWYHQDDVAYGHLVAFNEKGYSLRAAYATKWHALEYFRGRTSFLDLGGVAGTDGIQQSTTGLGHFKSGWATGRKQNYFCGKILDASAYAELTRSTAASHSSYFPAYRLGEFH